MGLIGLPLSEREARVIIDAALPAEKEGAGPPHTRRGIWEIEGSKISFENPTWNEFVNDVLFGEMFEALGLEELDPTPKCELSKLSIYEPGSR